MDSPAPSPARSSARQLFSRVLRRRGRRNLVLDVVALVVIVSLALVVVTNFSLPKEDPGPGWAKPETLPEAEPVWTQNVSATDAMLVHEDVLVRGQGSEDGTQALVFDLSTGEKIMGTDMFHPAVWLSGEYLIAMGAINGEEAVVYDIHSGEEVCTIKLTKFATVAVASGTLVSVEETGENDSRMRGIEVSTGKELWTKDLNKSQREWTLGAPNDVWQYDPFAEGGIVAESTSAVVLLNRRTTSSSSFWDRVDAIDVATGKQRWTSPLDYEDMINPREYGYMLTKSGDIYAQVASGNPDDEETTSYVIDVSSGKETAYPEQAEALGYEVETSSQDGFLPTDVVFEEVAHESDVPGESDIQGVRVYDVATGKTLWTRQGKLESEDIGIGVGDDVLSTSFVEESTKQAPIQVFDRDTGKGKWQIDGELAARNDDYFVFRNPDDHEQNAKLHVVSRDNPR